MARLTTKHLFYRNTTLKKVVSILRNEINPYDSFNTYQENIEYNFTYAHSKCHLRLSTPFIIWYKVVIPITQTPLMNAGIFPRVVNSLCAQKTNKKAHQPHVVLVRKIDK